MPTRADEQPRTPRAHPPDLVRGVAARRAEALRRRRRPDREPPRRLHVGRVPRRRGLLRPVGAPLPRPHHRPGAQAPGRRVHRPGIDARARTPRAQRPLRRAGLSDTKRMERITNEASRSGERIARPCPTWRSPPRSSTSPQRSPSCCSATRPSVTSSATRPCSDVFLWHALEESEHKAVAFDVYQAVGGSERLRMWTMKATRLGFVVGMSMQRDAVGARRPAAYRAVNLRRSVKKLRSPLVSKRGVGRPVRLRPPRLPPRRPRHTALIDEWRDRLFGETGTLNGLLPGGALRHERHRRGRAPRRADRRCRAVRHRRRAPPCSASAVGLDLRDPRVARRHRRHVGPVPLPRHPLRLRHVHARLPVPAVDRCAKAIADGASILQYIRDTARRRHRPQDPLPPPRRRAPTGPRTTRAGPSPPRRTMRHRARSTRELTCAS
jgi:hypothetical protein